jgi:Glycosyltransferase family 87
MNRYGLRILLACISLLMLGDFVFRGIAPAFSGGKNDFSEVYVGAWLWRHGENFYDAALTTATGHQIAGTQVNIVLIYPPTTLVLIAPLTFIPWAWANPIWLILGLVAIGLTISLLIRLAGFRSWEDRALVLATFILAFDPLHQSFHLGNVALFAVPLGLLGIYLAERERGFSAGFVLALATAVKPQLGLWVLLYYLIQWRKGIAIGTLFPGAAIAMAFVRYPVPAKILIAGYRKNLQYWFGPGRLYGFTEGALPFHVNISQVIFYQVLHRAGTANLLAYLIFILGLAVWGYGVWRARFRLPVPLAISSLVALSFISLYHSVSDVTALILALCWAFGKKTPSSNWPKRATCVIFLMLMLPGHSALMRATPHLAAWMTESWWWRLLVARYFIWLLLSLNAVLLYALVESAGARYNEFPSAIVDPA